MRRPRYWKVFGEAIRAYRKEAGLTQERLAELTEVRVGFVEKVERGDVNCSMPWVVKIARALGVRVTDLVRDV